MAATLMVMDTVLTALVALLVFLDGEIGVLCGSHDGFLRQTNTIITVRECAPLVSDVFTTCYRTFVQNHLDFGGLRDASQRRAIRFRAGSGYYSRTVI